MKRYVFSTSISETSENVVCFFSWLVSHEVYIHIQYFFLVWWEIKLQTLNIKIKTRSKVQEKNMSWERALNFDQWKTFSKNYEQMRVWLCLVYKFNENYCRWRLSSELNFFLWTKLLENLPIAKYLTSVAAPLINKRQFGIFKKLNINIHNEF